MVDDGLFGDRLKRVFGYFEAWHSVQWSGSAQHD